MREAFLNNIYEFIKKHECFHDSYIDILKIEKNCYMLSDIEVLLSLYDESKIMIKFNNTYEFDFSIKKNYIFSLIYEVRFKHLDKKKYYFSFNPTSCDSNDDISNDKNFLYCE